MTRQLKRLGSPGAWNIRKKEHTFVIKTAPGPHDGTALPVAVWLRDHVHLARNLREARIILNQREIIVNGRSVRDPRQGIGVFDIISIPRTGSYYRVLKDKKGRLVTIEIGEEDARTRLCKIANKTVVRGGKVQLNLLYGGNVLADHTYRPRDSVVLTMGDPATGEGRFEIIDHFPFAEGNMAMVIGGRHSGEMGRIVEIREIPGSGSNRVVLEGQDGERFDTIDDYVFMVGRENPAVESWGIEA
ncbi:MAG: 30S ribosomal protein S4e [Methanomicrobiales archaeon]